MVRLAVTYMGIKRKSHVYDCRFGWNNMSWILVCDRDDDRYRVYHNKFCIDIPVSASVSNRVGVYLDCPAGTLSFYDVSPNALTHLHTVQSKFTEPLYAGLWLCPGASVSLCQREEKQELRVS